MKAKMLGSSLIVALMCIVAVNATCSEVGNDGYALTGCWANPTTQVTLTIDGVSGPFCSFDKNNNTYCYRTAATPTGSCVKPEQVVGIVSPSLYIPSTAQPDTVTGCPRCKATCLSSVACGGGTDLCFYCKRGATPPYAYTCASTAKRGDVCLNEEGLEISC